jgi:glucose-6-phosphate dehydrogenase assembly protein OpcA
VAETVRILARGETGRHLASIIVPMLVHDLRVALWWPDDPQLTSHRAERLLPLADQLIVDGMSWSGDGLDRLLALAQVAAAGRLLVSDFALLRQARWREALASVYDLPDLRPHLRAIRSITIEFATSAGEPASSTNLVRPVYHVAWLASRLGMSVISPLGRARAGTRTATLRQRDHAVKVELRAVESGLDPGSTVRIQVASSRRGSELEGTVSAGDHAVEVEVLEMGRQRIRRVFVAPRLDEVDLLERAIEDGPSDLLAAGTLAMAARIIGPEPPAA